jgi:hypothetical protein
MTQRWSIGRAGVALAAAYALALQALLASLCVGGAVISHQLAGIAGAICTSNADRSAPVTPVDHDRTDCCILCSAPAPGATANIDVFVVVRDDASSRLIAPADVSRPGMTARLPVGARAPPRA